MRARAEAEPYPIPGTPINSELLAEACVRLRNPQDDWEPDWDALEDNDR